MALLLASDAPGRTLSPASVVVAFPSPGNVTVARLTLSGSGAPRLALLRPRTLPPGAYAVASVTGARAGRRELTVAVVAPQAPLRSGTRPASLSLGLPAGFTLVTPPAVARDVLYANPRPRFDFVPGGAGLVVAGSRNAPKLPIARLVEDAQRLAFDENVPLADAGLLELPYVSVELARSGTTLRATIGLSALSQVNAIELRFPPAARVLSASGPAAAQALPTGSSVQLIATRGVFEAGIPYAFTLRLSAMPKAGTYVAVRASVHYFESSLPFTERIAIP
jgi:hypothetical protein